MSNPGISVALPVSRADPALLARAVRCVQNQSLSDLDITLVLNGSDAPTTSAAKDLAASDRRIRILELPRANLAAALNLALREARHELIARMDADDECPPDRFARQAAYLALNPAVSALGTAYERIGPNGAPLGTVNPPTDPAEIRWRVLVENTFCHGSMMLRRTPVLDSGGYDPACERAQDYDLWIRLSRRHDLANLPEILYRHSARSDSDQPAPSQAQAATAARALLRAWRDLPSAAEASLSSLERAIAAAHTGNPAAVELTRAALNNTAPSPEGLLAWLLTRAGPATQATETCRRARLREVGANIAAAGVEAVWLWGAGRHTDWLLRHRHDLRLSIRGIIDDHRHGDTHLGFNVQPPTALAPGEHALLSSDWHEEALWNSSAPHRARGVHIWRLYADQAAASA